MFKWSGMFDQVLGGITFPQTGDGIAHRYVRWRWGVVSGRRDLCSGFHLGFGFGKMDEEHWILFPGFFRLIEGSIGILGYWIHCMMSWRQNIFLSRYFSMFRVSLGSLPSLTRNHIISVYTVYNIAIYIIYIYTDIHFFFAPACTF